MALAGDSIKKFDLAEGWEFYDTVFLEPHQIASYPYKPTFRKIPDLWERSLSSASNGHNSTGYGTYHIALLAPKIALGIRFDRIRTASKVFVNNDLAFENGVIGKNMASSDPLATIRYYYFNNESDTIHITIQVSNFHHRSGGMAGVVSIGTDARIRQMDYQYIITDIFSINLLLTAAVVFLLLFLFRIQDKPRLYFSLLLLIISLRILSHNDAVMFDWLHFSYVNAIRIDLFLQNIMALAILGYYFTLYPAPKLRIPNLIIISLLLLIALSGFFTTMFDLSNLVYLNEYFLVTVVVYGLAILCIRLFFRKPIAPLFLFAYLLFMSFSLLDLLFRGSQPELHIIFTISTIILFVISQITLLAQRQAQLLKNQEDLADRLAAANQSLEERVHQRTVLLERKNKSLQQSKNELEHVVKTKDKLFSIIGHDLRSPFSVINLYSEILWEEYEDEAQRKKLNYIINSSAAALHLLNNLLIWGKKELGGIKINPVFVAADELIQESVLSFHGIADSKNIRLLVDCDESVIYADRFVMLLIISNLINNALKFSYPGSKIIISSKLINPAPDGRVIISVTDNGVGIDTAALKKLKDGNGDTTTRGTAEEKGSGIGLLIVKEFTALNHGELRIESETGKGSVFSIILCTKMWS